MKHPHILRRVTALLLILTLVLLLAACGSGSGTVPPEGESVQGEETVPETPETQSPASEETPTGSQSSDGETSETPVRDETPEEAVQTLSNLVEDLYGLTHTVYLDTMMDPIEVDLDDPDLARYYLGVSGEGVLAAVFSEPMISGNPYSLCLVETAEGTDAAQLKEDMLNGVDLAKWICVQADKAAVCDWGSVILLIMASEETVDDVCAAFQTLAGDAAGETLVRYL